MSDVHVLYIAGIGRSGSTLLCRTLGSVDGFVGTGELMRIVERGVATGDKCSCGTAVDDCELWADVLRELRRRSPGLDLDRLDALRKRVTEGRSLVPYLLPKRPARLERDLRDYRRFLVDLYGSIRAVTGAQVIVDASKNQVFARLLCETPGIRVSVIHLVRDSRGVAHSLTRRKVRPGTHARHEHFRQHGVVLGSILWSAAHVMTETLRTRAAAFIRVRYEDFVANPAATITEVVRGVYAGAAGLTSSAVDGGAVRLGVDHLIASNPNRSRRGRVDLEEDLAWRREMSAPHRWLVTALTMPLLLRYGYRAAPGPTVSDISDVASL